MKRIIISFMLIGCVKGLKQLPYKDKTGTGNEYWEYVRQNKDKDLKEVLNKQENKEININILQNEEGEIALTLAARCNSRRVVNLLLNENMKEKVDVNAENSKGQTAIVVSILDAPKELERDIIISKLISKGADVNVKYGMDGNNTLMLSITQGDDNTVDKILNNKVKEIDINVQNLTGETALILAVKSNINQHNKINIINTLLNKDNIDINLKDRHGRTAISYGVINNDYKVIKLLTSRHDIDMNIIDNNGMSTLDHLNFKDFNIELAISLVEKGAVPNNKEFYSKASEEHLTEIMELLIEGGGDINYVKDNRTLLHCCIDLFNSKMDTSLKLARYLLERLDSNLVKGYMINRYIRYADERGSMLFYMLMIGHKAKKDNHGPYFLIENEIGDKLENKKNELGNKKNELLMKSILARDLDTLKTLLDNTSNIKDRDKDGYTALMYASNKGNIEVVRILLEKRTNVNERDNHGYTALMLASEYGYIEIVRLLLEEGANVNDKKDGYGTTALMYASQNGHEEIVKLLLKKGANINYKHNYGATALMYASNNGHVEIVKLLLEKGADVNCKDKMGYTALMWSSRKGDVEMTKLLIESGANVNDKTAYGATALIEASENGHKGVVKLLLEEGAEYC